MKGHFVIDDLDDNKILVTFKVVGTTFHQNEVDELLMKAMPDFSSDQNGQQEITYNYSIDLIPEPDNQYDSNAVKVVFKAINQPLHIGYLPKEFNWLYLKLIKILTPVTSPLLKVIKREAVCVGSNDDGTPRFQEFNDEFLVQFVLQNK